MTLNDTTFIEAAEALASKMLKSDGKLGGQIRNGFLMATIREPSDAELNELVKLYEQSLAHNMDLKSDSEEEKALARQQAMQAVAIVL